jgi:hypothetical protein
MKQIESPPSRQKFLKAKLRTKSPRAINVARINFRLPPFERSNEFSKNLRIDRRVHCAFYFFEYAWVVLE